MTLFLLAACQKDETATTVEQLIPTLETPTTTSTAIPTESPTESPTEIQPEDTPLPEATKTVEAITEEPVVETLFNTEAMLDRLGEYVLRPDDLPHSYLRTENGELHLTTLRLINQMGELEAKTYVRNTGRIDGWWLRLKRMSKEDFAPSAFESSIELFESKEGAQAAMAPENFQMLKDESRAYTQIDDGCNLGDQCEFYYSEKIDPNTELVIVQYDIVFTYKNAFVWVMARGLSVDMEDGYFLDAARTVLSKLESAPTK
jgi:hypothetical protein